MSGKKNSTGLEKISAILEAMGISKEARSEFVNVCENWHKEEKEKLQLEYKSRLDKAKAVCVQEVEAHKASLSRGVQVFLESKAEEIRKASENQTIAEPEAVSKLKQLENILGENKIGSAETAQSLAESKNKIALLVDKVAKLTESLDREKSKSSKFSDLAEKAVSRQRNLEEEVQKVKGLLSEAREHVKNKKVTIAEHKVKAKKPVSKFARESDVGKGKPLPTNDPNDIDYIAQEMD